MNPKYKALKFETMNKTDQCVILTTAGVSYLKEKCGEVVNKNGMKIVDPKSFLHVISHTKNASAFKNADIQRFDNRLFNLVVPFYTLPERFVIYHKL